MPQISVAVVNALPSDVDEKTLEATRKSILDGFIRILKPRSLGANAIVRDLVVNDIDLAMGRYAIQTASELEESLKKLLESDPLNCWPYIRKGLLWLLVALLSYAVGLHPLTPWVVSAAALVAGIYVMTMKCVPNLLMAAILQSASAEAEPERDEIS